jgi:hypothetical protein
MTILRDTTPIVFNKPEIIPKVWPEPSPSHNNIQVMINYALGMQAKSMDELLRRLTEEQDGKNLMLLVLILLLLLVLLVLFKLIHTQVVHQQAALQCHSPLPSP